MSDFEYEYYIPEDIEQFTDREAQEAEMLDSITQWVNCGNMTQEEGEMIFQHWRNKRV